MSKIFVQEPPASVDFELVPAEEYQAVLCEIANLGWHMHSHEGQNKGMYVQVQPVFQLNKEDSEGRRFEVRERPIFVKWSASKGRESNWVKFLTQLFGEESALEVVRKALEEHDFDSNDLLGANMLIKVVHYEAAPRNPGENPRTYPNIGEMTRWREMMGAKIEPLNYIPLAQRENYKVPEFLGDKPFPGDWTTGRVDEDYVRPQAAAAPAPAPAPSTPPTGVITAEQKREILVEGNRAYGPNAVATLREKIGSIDALTFDDAQAWIDWLLGEPDYVKPAAPPARAVPQAAPAPKAPAAPAADDDDTDPFTDE